MLKLYKRTLSLLLVLIMLLPSSTVVLAEESVKYKNAEKLLVALNIIEKDEPDVTVTRGKFADVFAKVLNIYSSSFVPYHSFDDTQDSDYYEAIEILHDKNYISGVGDNNFAPEKAMRVEDIARLYLCALGLEMYPQSSNITFWTAANRLGLLKNVSYTDEITVHNLIMMTYNVLVEAPIGKMVFTSEKSFALDRNDNLLYQNFKVIKQRGTVSANSVSGVRSKAAAKEGHVKITFTNGTVTAAVGNTDIAKYLGHTMNIYIEYGDDDNRVVCYEENTTNDVLQINIADIRFDSSTLSSILYGNDSIGTMRTTVAAYPAVIFNGVCYDSGAFDLSTLKNYEGTVTLIKSEGSDDYDIVSIVAYTDYFVSNVEYYDGEMRVFDKGANSKLVLNDSKSEIKIYHPNGAEASIYEVQADTLLTVLKSADSENIEVYICDDIDTKEILNINSDERRIVTKDNEEYRVSASYPIGNIEIGRTAKLYFDYLGNVGWVELDASTGYSYAIVCSSKYIRSEEEVELETFIKTGEFTKFTLAEKVKIDGELYKDPQDQIDALNAISLDEFATGYFPMRYILDEDGNIRNIDTPVYNSGRESRDSLRPCLTKASSSYTSDGILGKQLVVSESAKVFYMPADATTLDNYEFFESGGKSLMPSGALDKVMAFQTKENSLYANLVIVWRKRQKYGEFQHDTQLFLIDRILDVYDESREEVVKEVRGFEGGVEKKYRVYDEPKLNLSDLASLTKGDVVRFTRYKNELYDMEIIFQKDNSDPTILGQFSTGSEKNGVNESNISYAAYFYGYVRNREGKYLKIFVPNGNTVKTTTDWGDESGQYVLIRPENITVYDSKLQEVYVGDIEDIPYYDGNGKAPFVIVRYRSNTPHEMVVLK